ncbi:MAG: hypothetical protein GEV06_12805 [Luteitalea sp.]|nr:hypothetical protein [Luteitalea sp.]
MRACPMVGTLGQGRLYSADTTSHFMPIANRWSRVLLCLATLVLVSGVPARARAAGSPATHSARTGSVLVQVRDVLDGVLPGAIVTVIGPRATTGISTVTNDEGKALIADLTPGRYRLRIELPDFEPIEVKGVAVRLGRRPRVSVTLPLSGVVEEIVVEQDEGPPRLTDRFSQTISEEEIAQLPDDPDEMEALLRELAGFDAELRVNGFRRNELPPKSQIHVIRLRSDPFGPDVHRAGRPRIEVSTTPGASTWEHDVDVGFRDQSLDARDPFARERGVGQTRRLLWSANGPLVENQTSMALSAGRTSAFDAQDIVAISPSGKPSDKITQDMRRTDVEMRVEHALTASHTLRAEYQWRNARQSNLGVGQLNLPERAYTSEILQNALRLSDTGTFGEQLFNQFRLAYSWNHVNLRSLSDEVTINVSNTFVSGGAQRGGGSHQGLLEIADDLEIALNRRHSLRLGFEGAMGGSRIDQRENTFGTFTFANLAMYEAGQPRQFRQRIGDPPIEYSRYELGWYIYDEMTFPKNLRLGVGLRHELQSQVDDWTNFGPRASVAWTPGGKQGKTTLHSGFGVSYDWYGANIYEQTLRVDGTRQRDLIVSDPAWPDPFASGAEPAVSVTGRIQAAEALVMPATRRISVGVEHALTTALQVQVNAFGEATSSRFRSLNVNLPVDGQRPYPELGQITEVQSIGRETDRGVELSLRLHPRERRMSGLVRYRYAQTMNDADGPLSLPADHDDPAADWGPAADDVRHRIFGDVTLRLPYRLGAAVTETVNSSAPYTITTGFDENRDTVVNDRPSGVGRNSERGSWQRNTDLRLHWRSDDIPASRRGGTGTHGARRGVELYIDVQNLFNTTNFTGYSGVMTSPSFGHPTAAASGRRLELGTRVFF